MKNERIDEIRQFINTIGIDPDSGWQDLEECLNEIERLQNQIPSKNNQCKYNDVCMKTVRIAHYREEVPNVPDHYESIEACPCKSFKQKEE
jgi:regulator of PEP synthase PpsR (kinase-PPPase family)